MDVVHCWISCWGSNLLCLHDPGTFESRILAVELVIEVGYQDDNFLCSCVINLDHPPTYNALQCIVQYVSEFKHIMPFHH